jgi:hypothetical protein
MSEGKAYHFSFNPIKEEHRVLKYFFMSFASDGVKYYYEILQEAEDVEYGRIEEDPDGRGLIDVMGAMFYIQKKSVFFSYPERYNGPGEYEMPIREFKKMLLQWIKFMEVNIENFS